MKVYFFRHSNIRHNVHDSHFGNEYIFQTMFQNTFLRALWKLKENTRGRLACYQSYWEECIHQFPAFYYFFRPFANFYWTLKRKQVQSDINKFLRVLLGIWDFIPALGSVTMLPELEEEGSVDDLILWDS